MRINVTTNGGEIIDVLHPHDIGDLEHPHCAAEVLGTLRRLQARDRELQSDEDYWFKVIAADLKEGQ